MLEPRELGMNKIEAIIFPPKANIDNVEEKKKSWSFKSQAKLRIRIIKKRRKAHLIISTCRKGSSAYY